MAGGIIGSIVGGLLPDLGPTIRLLVERLVPDPVARTQAEQALTQLIAQREQALITALQKESEQQNAINLVEAQSPSIFVAGWRPACAWICTFGFAYSFILAPIVAWFSAIVGVALGIALPVPPSLDNGSLMTMLLGLLGLGGLRAAEKINGVGAANLSAPLPGAGNLPRAAKR